MKQVIAPLLKFGFVTTIGCLLPISKIVQAQVIPDGTVNTQVNQTGIVSEIIGGETRGGNLFHSFQEFSVGTGNEAFFNNASTIENIFSRVTGGNISTIDGLLRANGAANLFLFNPAGIIFGPEATLDIGGSFIGTTADSIEFSDGTVFSATDTQVQPILTINAPIGLNFRDNPGDIVNQSFVTDDTGFDLIGLRVPAGETIALVGGNVFIEGGFVSTIGGRIELGSVAENSTVSLTAIEQGFDIGYEQVTTFQDISLSFAASVTTSAASTADIEVQGKNISLIEGSVIGINPNFEGEAGKFNINASESLTLDGNGFEVGIGQGEVITRIFSQVAGDIIGEGSSININTVQLTLTNSAQITGVNDFGSAPAVEININAAEITLEEPFLIEDPEFGSFFIPSFIGGQVFEDGTGNVANVTINTARLTINDGSQISTGTFGPGNSGDLIINASESIELNGSIPNIENNQPSGLFSQVGIPLFPIPNVGDGGNVTINTPRLVVRDGAQINTVAQNNGNGGNLNLNVSESILLTGTSPSAELGGEGRSGIFVSAERSYEEFVTDFETGEFTLTGEIIPTTGNGGNLTLNTEILTIEQGALISADTFGLGNGGNANINVNQLILRDGGRISAGSLLVFEGLDIERGSGGDLNITATESVEITGVGDINGEPVNSSIFTSAESTGDAGNLVLTTKDLTISDGGDINASSIGLGNGGILNINTNSFELDRGRLTATTSSGSGANTSLFVQNNLILRNDSLIDVSAFETADGGNISIDSGFIIAFPSSFNGNDIIAIAERGIGGNIIISTKGILNIEERPAIFGNGTNDIDASSEFGLGGNVVFPPFDVDLSLSQSILTDEKTLGENACSGGTVTEASSFVVKGKGGIPPAPTEPFDSDTILVEEEIIPSNIQAKYPEIKPIKTSIGDIYPARGVIKTEDGRIILTAYATDNLNMRTPHKSANCHPSL